MWSILGNIFGDSAKKNIFKPDIKIINKSVDVQGNGELKVLRVEVKNEGSNNANDIEADLVKIIDPGDKLRTVIISPLWWMDNQFRQGDQRLNDIPMHQARWLDIGNLFQIANGYQLRLSNAVFRSNDESTKVSPGVTQLEIHFNVKQGHQKKFMVSVNWDGSFNDPSIEWREA
ncbi:MAG: hypothetical protein HZC01_00645 [Candidatus Kerfeldbacteria bacterium]|nr:hypothetical protein [Candidatus Kerfeldbacteria bacterium]